MGREHSSRIVRLICLVAQGISLAGEDLGSSSRGENWWKCWFPFPSFPDMSEAPPAFYLFPGCGPHDKWFRRVRESRSPNIILSFQIVNLFCGHGSLTGRATRKGRQDLPWITRLPSKTSPSLLLQLCFMLFYQPLHLLLPHFSQQKPLREELTKLS